MKKIWFTLLLGMVVFGACSNDDPKEKRELELVHVYEHSYKYEDMKISETLYTKVSYGSETDGERFGAYGKESGSWGYEITKELYELLQNTTVILYVNNIKIETTIHPHLKSWGYMTSNEKMILFNSGGSASQVSNPDADDFGKCYLYLSIEEYYNTDKWNKKDFVNEFLNIEAGNRQVKLEFYK